MKQKIGVLALLALMAAAPTAQAAGCWAAIAYNSSEHRWAEDHAAATLGDAETAALNLCGAGCEIVAWTDHGYVALAAGTDGGWGVSTAEVDAVTAEDVALEECNGVDSGCTWRVWVSGCGS